MKLLQERDILTLQELKRTAEDKFHFVALVRAEFSDHGAMQLALNTFAEKLDPTSVCVSDPSFIVSAEANDAVRRRATLAALANAKRKATECCHLVGAQLGAAVRICEDRTSELHGSQDPSSVEAITSPRRSDGIAKESLAKRASFEKRSWLEQYEAACVTVQVRLSASFEIQPSSRSKAELSVKSSPAK